MNAHVLCVNTKKKVNLCVNTHGRYTIQAARTIYIYIYIIGTLFRQLALARGFFGRPALFFRTSRTSRVGAAGVCTPILVSIEAYISAYRGLY